MLKNLQFAFKSYNLCNIVLQPNKMIQSDLDLLNESQKNAVISDAKRILVLAGAGSGKTKTLLQKIIHLIEDKSVSSSNG